MLTSIIAIIAALVCIVLFCRVTGVHDLKSFWEFGEGQTPSSQRAVERMLSETSGRVQCDILKDHDCNRIPGAGNKGWKQADRGTGKSESPGDRTDSRGRPGTGGHRSDNGDGGAGGQSAGTLEARLDTLKVAAPDRSKYSRTDYRHWITQNGSCDTRDIVLRNAGFASDPRTCSARGKPGFTYTEPYSQKKVSNPRSLDIDHTIPLEYVNQHGGASWDPKRKEAFANDLSQLVAVDASANRQKGSKGPGDWMPENKGDHCRYATIWVDTADKYGVSITQHDKDALRTALRTCG